MLRALRSRSAGWVAKILLILLIASFGIWGIGDVFRNVTQANVAEVGNRSISQKEFRTSYDDALRRVANQIGRQPTPAEGRMLGLDRQVLGEMMSEAALDQTAQDMKLNVSDAAVVASVRKDPNFAPGGNFNADQFRRVLAANGLTEAAFIALQRDFLKRRQILDSVSVGLTAPQPMLEAAHQFSNETRTISYVTVAPETLGDVALPDEAALRTFFDERKQAFRAPEYRKLVLLSLTTEALANPSAISDADLKARYDQQGNRFSQPERRTIDQLRFSSTEAAAEAKAAVAKGKSFDDLVTEQGQTVDAISLGTLRRNEVIDPAVGEAAFALPENAVSDPVAGSFGPALVRVRKIEAGTTQPLEEVRQELATEIAAERALSEISQKHDVIEDDRLSGLNLTEAAAKHGLKVETVESVNAQGNTPEGQAAALPQADGLLEQAFQTDVGMENEALRTGNNGYLWYEVTDITPARDRTFEEARQQVEAAWKNEEIAKRLSAKADELLKSLRDGVKLADLATKNSLTVENASGITREKDASNLGRVVASAVFETPVNGFGEAQGAGENSQVVFQVTGSETPPFNANADATKQLATRIEEAMESDIATTYVLQRQNELGSTVNQSALNAALGGTGDVN